MQEDIILVDAFLADRSEIAFRQLYRSRTPALFQMAFRLTTNQQEAEDLVQKAWMIAIEKIDGFQRRSTLKTWLTGILINLFRDQIKKKSITVNSFDDHKQSFPTTTSDSIVKIDLENAIQNLSPGYKEILILHDVEGYTHQEIGELLDIAVGTSKSQLSQARKKLREQLYHNYKTQ